MNSAVLFDFGGTLDADGLTWKERFYRLFGAEGVAVEPRLFDPVFYAADDALVGAVPETFSLDETVRRVADGVAGTLRPDDAGLGSRIAARFLADAREYFASNAPILERLARRHRLGVVSNFYGNLATVCDNAQVRRYFGVIVDSARVGLSKPDPRIFMKALDALGIDSGRAVMVGDSLARDMAGARAAGMAHIWLTPASERQGRPCCPGDRVIRSLRDLEGLLP